MCQERKERLEQDLARFGQMAEHFAPAPVQRVSLPVEEFQGSRLHPWNLRVVLGAVITTALVILVVSWSLFFRVTPEGSLARLTQEMWEDDHLITEISMLEENPLPQPFLGIPKEPFTEIDEEFIEFVVPDIDNKTLSYNQGKGGITLC
ncbi:MAG: hypothetical protein U9P49_14095 [Thermodesulfobacteriota bacterium]|nr:hypothetical protein [Thermodesulfobacteriota bacterium]